MVGPQRGASSGCDWPRTHIHNTTGDNTLLAQLVKEFTRTHEGEHFDTDAFQTTTVQCQSYWQQLLDLVEHGNGGVGSLNGQASRILGNQDARELQTRITRTVNQQWPGTGRQHLARKPTPEKIRLWAAHARGNQDQEQHLTDLLSRWIRQIDGLAQPELGSTFPPCPECEHEYFWTNRTHGRERRRALESNGKAVWCNACQARWEGLPGMRLLARILTDNQQHDQTPPPPEPTEPAPEPAQTHN